MRNSNLKKLFCALICSASFYSANTMAQSIELDTNNTNLNAPNGVINANCNAGIFQFAMKGTSTQAATLQPHTIKYKVTQNGNVIEEEEGNPFQLNNNEFNEKSITLGSPLTPNTPFQIFLELKTENTQNVSEVIASTTLQFTSCNDANQVVSVVNPAPAAGNISSVPTTGTFALISMGALLAGLGAAGARRKSKK